MLEINFNSNMSSFQIHGRTDLPDIQRFGHHQRLWKSWPVNLVFPFAGNNLLHGELNYKWIAKRFDLIN